MSTDTDRVALTSMSVLSADVVERLVGPGPGVPGVEEKTLWRFGDFAVALIRYSPGSGSLGRGHLAAHHHIWVVSGSCTLAGRRLRPVVRPRPPGAEHAVGEVGPEGCTPIQMHRPHPRRRPSLLPG